MLRTVNAPVFLTTFLCASGLLALWVDARLADRSPSSLRLAVFLTITGVLGLRLAKDVAVAMISPDNPALTMAVLFGLVLPALVYVFLTAIWMLKLVRGAMPR